MQVINICKNIGGIEIQKLTPLQIKEHINAEFARGIKANSIGTQMAIFKCAMRKAEEWQIITKNPCEYIKLPKRTEPKNAIYSPEQVEKLLLTAKSTNLYLPCVLGFLCGLRRGEICGLRWQDIDIETKTADIQHSFDRNPLTKTLELGKVKTMASKSKIVLSDIVIIALKQEQLQQKEHQLKNGPNYKNLDFTWAHSDGSPYLPDYLYAAFIKLLKKAGLPVIRPHDMRHTFATLLWESGLDDKSISAAARHAKTSFTSDYYVHLRQTAKNRPAAAIDSMFKRKLEKD